MSMTIDNILAESNARASVILSADESREITATKADLMERMNAAKTDGEARRLAKQITELQKALDADLDERRRTGFDAARAEATRIAYGTAQAAGSDPELRAFATPGSAVRDYWLRPACHEVMVPARQLRSDFLTSDTATVGSGYYFTSDLHREVVMGLLDASGVLEANPTILLTDHLRDVQVPRITADATATAGTEGSAATDANPTGGAVTLGAFRYDGKFTVSAEMLMSSEIPLEKTLATFAERALQEIVAEKLALGAGTTEPTGLFTASVVTVGETAASETTITVDEWINLVKSVPKGYRKRMSIVASDVAHTELLLAKSGLGEYLIDTVDGGGYSFAGKPMYTEPQADQTSMSTGEVHVVAGDFSGYFVRLSPMFFRRSDADPLNPEFSFALWIDAQLVDEDSLRSLDMK